MTKAKRRTRLLFWKSIWIRTGTRKVLFEPSFTIERKIRKMKVLVSKIKTSISLILILRRSTVKARISKRLREMKRMMKILTNLRK
jgi:hypothetical protein